MKLDEEQQRKVLDYIKEKWQEPRTCPICKHDDWGVSDRTFEVRDFTGGGISVGGGSYLTPVIAVTCDNCGYILFLNAMQLGVVKQPEKKNKSSKTETKNE
ncbi:unnamed protein product [marine sediment metagenome]|uniref:Uncharacterized protein n=1 Tax=marine sediment metagenome TaxID=412755 RepID=X1HWF0_9ZZZZ